jgi:hypothetical protein
MLRNLKENAACAATAHVLTFCTENEVILTESHPSSSALPAVEPRSSYFAGKTHYESLARRILAVVRAGGRFILITGDPPADPQYLSQALGNLGGSGYAIIDIRCGPELRVKGLEGAAPILGVPGTVPGCSSVFLFIDFDQLSDRQIEEVHESTLHADPIRAAGVLLAPPDFLDRLERPALHFLKERLAAHFRVQEVGDDEAITFLHNQLLAQRDRRSEARGFRRGILIGLAGCGVVLAASAGAFLILHPTAEPVSPAPASAGEGISPSHSDKVSMLRPPEGPATSPMPAQSPPQTETTLAATAPPPLSPPPLLPTEAESPPRVAPAAGADAPTAPPRSASDIAKLLVRGDAFLSTGDVASARLFYERAADAGDGLAALQLGATFDPVMLSRASVRGVVADPAQAMSWYRRARELGAVEAEHRIKALQSRAFGETR